MHVCVDVLVKCIDLYGRLCFGDAFTCTTENVTNICIFMCEQHTTAIRVVFTGVERHKSHQHIS